MDLMFPKPRPLALDRQDKKRSRESLQTEVYRAVEKRDGFRCRACWRRWQRGFDHHHHLKFRSQGGYHSESNVVLLCRQCHGLVHTYRLIPVGKDANRSVRFERQELS